MAGLVVEFKWLLSLILVIMSSGEGYDGDEFEW